jgi:hypothetical protein
MKNFIFGLMIILIASCGDSKKGERCRGAEEMQMLCQVEWAEEYKAITIPEWVQNQCQNFYPAPGCYYDSTKRHYW